MNTLLIDNIKKRLSSNDMSVSELERRAGLKQSSVQNILHGRSKNPSVETIRSIAHELNCSIEELIGEISDNLRDQSVDGSRARVAQDIDNDIETHKEVWNANLYIQAIETVQAILDIKNAKLSKKQVLAAVDEVYRYSIGSSDEIDRRFAEWIIDKVIG